MSSSLSINSSSTNNNSSQSIVYLRYKNKRMRVRADPVSRHLQTRDLIRLVLKRSLKQQQQPFDVSCIARYAIFERCSIGIERMLHESETLGAIERLAAHSPVQFVVRRKTCAEEEATSVTKSVRSGRCTSDKRHLSFSKRQLLKIQLFFASRRAVTNNNGSIRANGSDGGSSSSSSSSSGSNSDCNSEHSHVSSTHSLAATAAARRIRITTL